MGGPKISGVRTISSIFVSNCICIFVLVQRTFFTMPPTKDLYRTGVSKLFHPRATEVIVQKVKTQLSRACGILSKLKHYTTPPVLKVVYNSLTHPYLNYSILNWGLASNATIQPLVRLQNKAIKIINPTNTGSLEEHCQHLNILCLPKLYSFSVGKFMHSYHIKLLQIILMNILFYSGQFIITPQD